MPTLRNSLEARTLAPRPRKMFMTLRDINFWIRSARADFALGKLRQAHGTEEAFDRLYAQSPDPWGATLSCYRYQRQKYETLLSLLPDRRYQETLDIGCGLGVLTRQLSGYTDRILGVDLSQVAVAQAARLSEGHPNTRYQQANVLHLEQSVQGQFDLVVLADVLYYLGPLTAEVLTEVTRQVTDLLAPGGILLLANHCFFGLDADSKITHKIHASFRASASLELVREKWWPFYLESIFQKR